jgi:hypothetical protein
LKFIYNHLYIRYKYIKNHLSTQEKNIKKPPQL